MKTISLGNTIDDAPQIILGCMRISKLEDSAVDKLIGTAIDSDINMFDHADIYGDGESEIAFAKAYKALKVKREDVIIQSKCGIGKGEFNSSKNYITDAVDGILSRLDIEYLDTLLIHRADILVEPEEVAEVFTQLHVEGKVKHFGVSNHNPMQIDLLKKYVDYKLVANQLQFSVTNTNMIDTDIYANIQSENRSIDHDGYILNYCRINDITIQAWSPMFYGFFEGIFIESPKFPELNSVLQKLADKYSVTKSAIAIAWILRHPARMQAIIGTTKPQRVIDTAKAGSIDITREEWYQIYTSAGNKLP